MKDIVSVVAVTAFVDTETVDRCYETGMVDVLNKPVNQENLEKVLETYYY